MEREGFSRAFAHVSDEFWDATNSDRSADAVTDPDGRFLFPSIPIGTYRVMAELPGFKTTSGDISLSSSVPKAFLGWSLEVGCLAEAQRVILGPKAAAPAVDSIVHIRVATNAGPALISVHPDCEGQVLQEYLVQVLSSASARNRTSPAQIRMFMEPHDAALTPGQEYLALLWRDGYTTNDLVLPIVSGRVVSPGVGDLNGLRANDALKTLQKWSVERRR